MPGFTAPKLAWVRTHEPEVFAAVRTVLLPKDYVRLRMTGDKASDLSDAAGTLWVDVARREWSPAMLATTGLSEAHMPTLYEGPEPTGRLRAEVADAWGMARVPMVAGGGDNAAGAVGVGVIERGDALLSLGTSGVLFVAGDAFLPNPDRAVHAFCHALPGRWHQMSVMLSAASCVEWAATPHGRARTPARCWRRSRPVAGSTGPKSSCRTCRANGRRTTTHRRVVCCSVSTTTATPRPSVRPCWKAWRSASPTAWTR